MGIQVWTSGGGWTTPSSTPWLEHAAVWDSLDSDGKAWWAFAMVLSSKLVSGATYQDGDAFDMWYTYIVYTSPDLSTPPAQYNWPWARSASIIVQQLDTTLVSVLTNAPDPSPGSPNWGTLTVKTVTTGCAGDVALDRMQIGTFDPALTTPSSEIKLSSPNQFVARPTNMRSLGDAALPANSITAKFFLANWGSVPDNSTVWRKISPATPPDNDGNIPAPDPAHGDPNRNDIHFDWTVPAADVCRYDPTCPTPGRKHQCVLVELSSGLQLVFINKSVFRNMDFVPGSRFEREAEISVVGLPALRGKSTRDVYLYIETANMPRLTEQNLPAQTVVLADTQYGEVRDTAMARRRRRLPLPGGAIAFIRVDTIVLPAGDSGGRTRALNAALTRGLLTQREIDALMPTYRVHVYHATGDSFTVHGRRLPILRAQSSFGYWVDHKGSLSGWTAKLTGARLERLSRRWYRLAVPNDSFAVVNSIIKAIGVKPFALSLHGGVTLPTGALKTAAKSGFGITADLEHRLNRTFSVALLFGFHRFDSVATSGHLDVQHLSGSLQTTVGSGVTRLMFDAGGGTYTFKPGASNAGAHAGVGVALELSPYVGLSAHFRAHRVFTGGPDTGFYTIQAGGRVRF